MLAVLFLPPLLRLDDPVWALPAEQLPHVLVLGAAYLAAALATSLLRGAPGTDIGLGRAVIALGGGMGAFAATASLILLRPDLPYSRVVIAMAGALTLVLVWIPLLLSRWRAFLLGGLLATVAGAGIVGFSRAGLPAPRFGLPIGEERPIVVTSHERIRITYRDRIVGPQVSRGGALEPIEGGLLLATGAGELYRLTLAGDDDIAPSRLERSVPFERAEFIADNPRANPTLFRVSDVAVDEDGFVYVSHHHWSREEQCLSLRVSVLSDALGFEDSSGGVWRTLFEARPCLEVRPSIWMDRAGGRMAWAEDGRLLLTIGDHGYDGLEVPAIAHEPGSQWGKILAIDADGEAEIVARGFRNPQGLAVDPNGRVWITDQGPEGGDEIDLLVAGGDYGWPSVTYGTHYLSTEWPPSPAQRDHGTFLEPAHVWVPSVAPSGLISLDSSIFPSWQGDLMVSSLRAMSLFRIHIVDDRVVYAEPIVIGRRIRDLAQGPDGRIFLWTEEGALVVVEPVGDERSTEVLFAECATCHEPSGEQPAAAPDLRGVFGRRIASVPGFPYSAAMQNLEGRWNARLADFLRNPTSVVPGTSMEFEGISDEDELRRLMDFLRSYR